MAGKRATRKPKKNKEIAKHPAQSDLVETTGAKPGAPRLQLLNLPPSSLKPYERNPRKNDDAIEAVAKSIDHFGFNAPIIVDQDYRVCVGHTRLKAAIKRGMATVPVLVVSDLTGDKFKGYNIADNQTGTIAEWDDPVLWAELQELEKAGIPAVDLGFDEQELRRILAKAGIGGTDADDAPVGPPPEVPVTQPGDLWIMGAHRLLCGDATKAEDVAKLLGENTPFIMVTDPPYGVNYDPDWRSRAAQHGSVCSFAARRVGKVVNDDRSDWGAAWDLFPGVAAYTWSGAGDVQIASGAALQRAGFEIRCQIIWSKPHFVFSRGQYKYRHEPCWYAIRKGQAAKWVGEVTSSTVWDIALDPNVEGGHSTQKPVECMARPIRNHGGKEDDVYDPFVGSGTTIIAAERLGRRCFAMEIDPGYCDVTVNRWENATGKKAERIPAGAAVTA